MQVAVANCQPRTLQALCCWGVKKGGNLGRRVAKGGVVAVHTGQGGQGQGLRWSLVSWPGGNRGGACAHAASLLRRSIILETHAVRERMGTLCCAGRAKTEAEARTPKRKERAADGQKGALFQWFF